MRSSKSKNSLLESQNRKNRIQNRRRSILDRKWENRLWVHLSAQPNKFEIWKRPKVYFPIFNKNQVIILKMRQIWNLMKLNPRNSKFNVVNWKVGQLGFRQLRWLNCRMRLKMKMYRKWKWSHSRRNRKNKSQLSKSMKIVKYQKPILAKFQSQMWIWVHLSTPKWSQKSIFPFPPPMISSTSQSKRRSNIQINKWRKTNLIICSVGTR